MSRVLQKVTLGTLLVTSLSLVTMPSAWSGVSPQDQTQPDNTRKNRDQSSPTADQQKMNTSDRDITQKIRKSIMSDKSLSTYAHNVKIIAQDGKVTLRGPVRSDDEKTNVESKAAAIVGPENLTSQIEVATSK